jgi:cytochrome c oxidase assembly protein subunit 15
MFMIVGVLLLIFIGGQVKSTNSGMSVPDWPNTYGHFMFSFPWEKMVGGIFWEHSHRLIASGMGLFTIILTILVYKIDSRIWVKRIGMLALIAVIVQGALGGLTVMFNLPAWISSSHGTLAQIYLCIITSIALITSPCWVENPIKIKDSSKNSLRKIATITTFVIFSQLLIGAIMRHSEAGLAIPDFPLMYGKLIPPLTESALIEANNQLLKFGILSKSGNSFITAPQMFIHFLHRLWAFVVVISVVLTFVNVNKNFKNIKQLHFPALILLVLVFVQFSLGVLTILTEKQFTITSIHVVVGASTLATSFVLMVRSKHLLIN